MHKSWIAAVIVGASAVGGPLYADAPELSFDGFATLGVVYSDEDRADFVADTFVSDGAGYRRDWSAEVDSRIGLQLTARFSPRLSAVVQVVSEQLYDDSYRPTVEWANLRFDLTPDLSLRAGRMVLPFFLVSEYRKVGYANPWIRPPQEVYQLAPITNADGIDFSYRSHLGELRHTLSGIYGAKNANLAGGGEVEASDLMVIVSTLEWGQATLSASYSTTRLTIDEYQPLFDAFRALGPEGEAIADRYDIQHQRFRIMSVGLRYDPGEWFAMAEWARSKTRTFLGETEGWYATVGYRLGSVTPYLTLAGAEADTSDFRNLRTPDIAGLDATLDLVPNTAAEQQRIAAGIRWDFARNYAFKAQIDHLDLDSGSAGHLRNVQPGFDHGSTVSVFSVAVDAVF